MILSGTAVVEARGETMIEVGPGEFVGELALLVPEATRSARVRAQTDVRCLAIFAGDFQQLLEDEPRWRLRCCRSSPSASGTRASANRGPNLQSTAMAEKLIADNRKARHDYQLLERVEAGLVLTGTEVKSLRDGRATLGQAYADVRDGEAWLHGAEIAIYDQGNRANHEPTRPRKLLLHRREIDRLYGQVREKGLTLVPTRLYFKDGPREGRARARARQGRARQAAHGRRPRREAADRARDEGAALRWARRQERTAPRGAQGDLLSYRLAVEPEAALSGMVIHDRAAG